MTSGVKQFEGDGGNAEQSSKVACVVNVYGPSDFTRSYAKSVDAAQVLPLFLGGNLEQARHKHILASPLSWVAPEAIPSFRSHGTDDIEAKISVRCLASHRVSDRGAGSARLGCRPPGLHKSS